MAAGDLVVMKYQFELRTLLMGVNSNYRLAGPVTGIGRPPTKPYDTDLDGQAGSVGAPDQDGVRVITIPLGIREATDDLAAQRLAELETAWAKSSTDIPLYLWWPYRGKHHFMGRPRDLVESAPDLPVTKSMEVLATFVALDPTRITP